jgi:hypothetical protein
MRGRDLIQIVSVDAVDVAAVVAAVVGAVPVVAVAVAAAVVVAVAVVVAAVVVVVVVYVAAAVVAVVAVVAAAVVVAAIAVVVDVVVVVVDVVVVVLEFAVVVGVPGAIALIFSVVLPPSFVALAPLRAYPVVVVPPVVGAVPVLPWISAPIQDRGNKGKQYLCKNPWPPYTCMPPSVGLAFVMKAIKYRHTMREWTCGPFATGSRPEKLAYFFVFHLFSLVQERAMLYHVTEL